MPRIARKDLESGFFHIMIQGINKENIFYKNEYKETYIDLINLYRKRQNIKILAYCIMRNHAHILIYTKEINEMADFMQRINTTYALYYNKKENRVGYVYRDRYKSEVIYNQKYLTNCIKYIHMNPVKANIVKLEKDYPFSSYNDYINKTGIIDKEILSIIFLSEYSYLKEFLKFEYIEGKFIEIEENINLQEEVNLFLRKQKIDRQELRKNKDMIRKLYNELTIKTKVTKTQYAKLLQIERTKISRILK